MIKIKLLKKYKTTTTILRIVYQSQIKILILNIKKKVIERERNKKNTYFYNKRKKCIK